MPGESIRTFIALEISDEIKDKIAEIQEKIKATNSLKGKWVSKDNIHLTLQFLGDTQLEKIEDIKNAINECSCEEKSINCNLSNAGAFPNERFPRVIWVGIKGGDAEIINLAKKLEKSLHKLGFKKEKRSFKAHLTICRAKQVLNHGQLKSALEEINNAFRPQEFVIDKITFFKSQLTPQGPIYTPLHDYLLK